LYHHSVIHTKFLEPALIRLAPSSTHTRMHSSVGSCPTGVGTCNPSGLTHPMEDSGGHWTVA